MTKYLIVVLILTACSPSAPRTELEPASESAAVSAELEAPSPTPKTDLKVASFLALPAIGTEPGMTHKESRTAKMKAAKLVNDELKAHLDGAGRDLVAHVQFQRARLFMAVACQLLAAPPVPGSSDAQIAAHDSNMMQAAHLFFPGVQNSLRAAVDADGGKSPRAAQILLLMETSPHPNETCERTRAIWKPST